MKYASYQALILMFALSFASPRLAQKPETPHLVFVTEYVRELAAVEDIRASAEQENEKAEDNNAKFLDAIHSSTRFQLELRTQIRMLGKMHLNPPFDTLIPNITNLYEEKVELYQEVIDICTVMLAGPKPEVDYGKLAAEMPKTRAKLEYIDETLFDATAAITFLLVDQRPDSHNQLSHLLITKAERAKLISDLNADFGTKLDQKNPNFTVASACLLKTFLLKDYKCSDDPWEDDRKDAIGKTVPGEEELAKANDAHDSAAAAAWLLKAAAKGNPDAQVQLADMYMKGDGVPRSCEPAVALLKTAAEQGNARARNRLASLYATGICVEVNRVEAYRWLSLALAVDPGSQWAQQNKDLIWQQMTPEERATSSMRH